MEQLLWWQREEIRLILVLRMLLESVAALVSFAAKGK